MIEIIRADVEFSPNDWGWEKGDDQFNMPFWENVNVVYEPISLYKSRSEDWILGKGIRGIINSDWRIIYKGPIDTDLYKNIARVHGIHVPEHTKD